MPTTIILRPTTATNGTRDISGAATISPSTEWTNLSNVYTDNNQSASAVPSDILPWTKHLVVGGFNTSDLPELFFVHSLKVNIKRAAAEGDNTYTYHVLLKLGGINHTINPFFEWNRMPPERNSWTTSLQTESYETIHLQEYLNPQGIKRNDLEVAVSTFAVGFTFDATIEIDSISIEIEYTELNPLDPPIISRPLTLNIPGNSAAGDQSGNTLIPIGGYSWSNPTRALTRNNSYATVFNFGTQWDRATKYLYVHGFDFSQIPSTANIKFIKFDINRRASVSGSVFDDDFYRRPAIAFRVPPNTNLSFATNAIYKSYNTLSKWSNTVEQCYYFWDVRLFDRSELTSILTNQFGFCLSTRGNEGDTSEVDFVGMTVFYDHIYNETPTNPAGVKLSGTSIAKNAINENASGGSRLGGNSLVSLVHSNIYAPGEPVQGVSVSGELSFLNLMILLTEGGISANGNTLENTVYNSSTEGGLAATGESEQFIAYSTEGSGVIASGGDAAVAIHIIPTGGIMIAGSASETVVYNEQFSGSALSGGELVIQLTYAAPPIFGAALLGGRGIRVHIKNLVFYHESMILKMKSPNRYNQPKPRTDRIMGNNPTNPNVRSNPFSQDTPSKWALAGDSDRSGWVATITKNRQGEFMPPKV